MAGKTPGPEPILEDPEMLRKIKQSILDGNDIKTTANVCGIPESSLYTWTSSNYLNISDKIEGWKRDRKLMLADRNIEAILALGISDDKALKVVADMSKFVKETLDKENYSKRSEMTGKGGTPLIPENTPEIEALTNQLNEIHKGTSEPSDGEPSITMDTKI